MNEEQLNLGLKLAALANQHFRVVDKQLEDFVVAAAELAFQLLKPQSVVVEAPSVTVDLTGLQNHENGSV